MATWLAADQLDFQRRPGGGERLAAAGGAAARAARAGARARLARLPGGLHRPPLGRPHAAERLGARRGEIGRQFDVPDLEMLGLALQGAALVAYAEVEEGMRCLDEATATALAGEATVPISGAWACCFLVSACTAVLDYERAFEWCDRIAEFAERYGSRYMLAFCRAEYGDVHLWRGRWSEAEEMLEASIEDFSPLAPGDGGGAARRPRRARGGAGPGGGGGAAARSGGAVGVGAALPGPPGARPGDARRAVELVERLLRQRPRAQARPRPRARAAGPPGWRVASSTRQRAALEALRELERLVGTAPLRARADLAEGILAAARATTSGLGRCSRTPSIASSGAAPRSRPRRRGSSWPRASWR